LLFLVFTGLLTFSSADVIVIREFQPPTGDEFIGVPNSMSFSPDGLLFVADQNQSRILIWNDEGLFSGAFGQPGQGPGELSRPAKIYADDAHLYVWDQNRRISVFDHKGSFKSIIPINSINPRTFTKLDDGLFLTGYQIFAPPEGIRIAFDLYDGEGNRLYELFRFGNNVTVSFEPLTVKAYGPEIDIQRAPNGNWFFGFSQDSTLYEIDATGEIVKEIDFDLPSELPTDADEEYVLNMTHVTPDGKRHKVSAGPLKNDFSHPKAHYTNLFIKGDKIAFILTPIGSSNILNGFSRATFRICDFTSRTVVSRGSYEYPEDSRVFYRNGRALALIANEEDAFDIKEITLQGM